MRLLDSLIFRALDRKARRLGAEFSQAADRPEDTQLRLLKTIVRRERNTGFGRDHKFSEIRTVADFRRQVPIGGYERLAPYIDRVLNGETEALFRRQSVLMFAMTSGTSAARKYIPVTRNSVDAHRKGWFLWALATYEGRQHLIFRPKFNFSGDDSECFAPSGVPCGSISGFTARMQSPLVRRTYCLPLAANKLHDTHAKYYLAWRVGLTRDVASWMSPNPSTHLALARFGDANKERLIRDVRDGTLAEQYALTSEMTRQVRHSLRPNPRRARELEAIVRRTGHLYPKDVWPNFGLLACWLGGPLTAYLRFFPEYFGDVPKRDLGLIASECRMTVPLEDDTPAGVLDLFGTFFEFVPVDEIDSPQPTVLLPHELQEGCDYYVLLTTSSGLYRYDIQDVVRCVGWHGRTPLIEFQHKGKHISSVTGEKLSEIQVSRAADAACERLRLRLASYAVAPCFEGSIPYYGLFVELDEVGDRWAGDRLASRIDEELRQANCEYDAKRASLRLGPLRLRPLPAGAWVEFDRKRLKKTGATAEQYKRPRLFAELDFAASMPTLRGVPVTAEMLPAAG
ncbi:MAG: GH3 auxin-responsive promoter family protein [Planctomycetota bacterium]|nr:GH3 auxin-responsive promoter family protein [Planctomycetaceae bacterium]MDQ3331747.1 GH3 auxin-responsive promoter family protein [Planctomycetota bacterium]